MQTSLEGKMAMRSWYVVALSAAFSLAACSDDDSGNGSGGSGGTSGASGSGGSAGSSGSGGSSGTGGAGGSGGSAGASGSAGSAGSGGSAGSAGSAGAGGSAGSAGSAGTSGSGGKGGSGGGGTCTSSNDCKTYSSYCADAPCQCIALGKGDKNPPCSGGTITCTVDPCLNKTAICDNGACVISGSTL